MNGKRSFYLKVSLKFFRCSNPIYPAFKLSISFQINNKQKKSEVNIRTVVNLPGGTGKKIKVAVVCEDNKAADAKSAGADLVGSDDFIEKIDKEKKSIHIVIPDGLLEIT